VEELPEIAAAAVPAGTRLLDVREADEWSAGHIPGARHIPMYEVPARLAELDPTERVVVVCKVGGRSAAVTEFLRRHGLDAVNLAGGMVAWQAAGREMVSEVGARPVVR